MPWSLLMRNLEIEEVCCMDEDKYIIAPDTNAIGRRSSSLFCVSGLATDFV